MPVRIIVSYDGTSNDDDALVLARLLADAGAELSLAYVRHSAELVPGADAEAARDAQARLDNGAAWLGAPDIATHIVLNGSTRSGLESLAAIESADLIVFGSEYRTPAGTTEPQGSANALLDNGSTAIAIAAAGLRLSGTEAQLATIAPAGRDPSGAAARTARSLAGATGAELVTGRTDADLIVVDSLAAATRGRVSLDGATRNLLDSSRGSVIVLGHDAPLAF